MSKFSLRRDLLWLFFIGLTVQAFWLLRLSHPTYFDAYYYASNGQRLAEGYGFSELVIWQYLDDPAGLPTPSHTYWMPLPSILAAIGYRLFGTFRAAQIPFWLLAGLLPLLSYLISWRLTTDRWSAWAAGLFTAAGGYYAAYMNQPSTFALFGAVGGACLLTLAHALEQRQVKYWFLTGILAGLGHLTRADGLLLLAVAMILCSWAIWKKGQPSSLFWLFLGYLLVMGGWFYRTWELTGRLLSPISTETLFLTHYNDLFAYGRHATLAAYLDWGLINILRSKVQALWLALQTFVAVTGFTAFTFFLLVGWLHHGRRPDTAPFLRPFTLYTLLLYATMSLLFTFPGQRGSLLHSSTALWPWSMALVVSGVTITVNWIAARRRHWQPDQARRLFTLVFGLFIYLLTFIVSGGQPLRDETPAIYQQVAALIPAGSVVMTSDPPGFYYHTRLPTVVAPNDPPAVVLEIARRYGVNYLLLDDGFPPPLQTLYEDQLSWPEIKLVQIFDQNIRLYAINVPK